MTVDAASSKSAKIVVVGLGYVGLPLAVALAKSGPVVGFDVDRKRIAELRDGHDRTNEITGERLLASPLTVTAEVEEVRGADIYIVTVPTPVDHMRRPDLNMVIGATKMIGQLLEAGKSQIIVYESTVYPGVTEDICGPLLEQISGLKRGTDFFLGYSPERINPGDREHTVDRITKVVAGENAEISQRLAALYGSMTSGGVFVAASIKAAEAAKVIENAQRDINIAFINEVTHIFSAIDLSIWDVLDAARTKWNFLDFRPGLVGGHCIGVDPFYLSHLAEQIGHEPRVILAGRSLNDGMGGWVADRIHTLRKGRAGSVLMLGLTFKENVPDLRNSKVIDVVRRLEWLGHSVTIHDPHADAAEAEEEYGVALAQDALNRRYDIVVAAVAHDEYRNLSVEEIASLIANNGMLADLKGLWRGNKIQDRQVWTL